LRTRTTNHDSALRFPWTSEGDQSLRSVAFSISSSIVQVDYFRVRRFPLAARSGIGFRSVCDTTHRPPELSTHGAPAATPHVGRRSEYTCILVMSLIFVLKYCDNNLTQVCSLLHTLGPTWSHGAVAAETRLVSSPLLAHTPAWHFICLCTSFIRSRHPHPYLYGRIAAYDSKQNLDLKWRECI
jgi:hypothetical protein